MKKRNGFCLLPVFFGLLFFVGIVIIIVFIITGMLLSPTIGNESFADFKRELIEEYDISNVDIFVDTDAVEVYFSSERVSLEESREIMELTREYMLVDENYAPYLEQFMWENGVDEPESVRIRFEPLLSMEFYYQYTAESFDSTKWIFESNIDGNYYREEYDVFDFVKTVILNMKRA